MNTTARFLPCNDGICTVQPDVDRWTQFDDEAFPTTRHPWDQISGKHYCKVIGVSLRDDRLISDRHDFLF